MFFGQRISGNTLIALSNKFLAMLGNHNGRGDFPDYQIIKKVPNSLEDTLVNF